MYFTQQQKSNIVHQFYTITTLFLIKYHTGYENMDTSI